MGRKRQQETLSRITQSTAKPGASAAARPARIASAPAKDPVTAKGVPLRASEWAELEGIAREHGATLASLLSMLVRRSLRDYRAGKVTLTTKGKRFISPE